LAAVVGAASMVFFVFKKVAATDNRMTEISLGFPKSAKNHIGELSEKLIGRFRQNVI